MRFRVVYTTDNWATNATLESKRVGYPGSYADIATEPGQSGKIDVYAALAGGGPLAWAQPRGHDGRLSATRAGTAVVHRRDSCMDSSRRSLDGISARLEDRQRTTRLYTDRIAVSQSTGCARVAPLGIYRK